jgi:Ca2+-transporting ATPase
MSAQEPAPPAWHALPWEQAAAVLVTDASRGLSAAEAGRRLAAEGPNELLDRSGKSPWRIVWEQFTATMIVILIVASALSAAVGDLKDAVAIGVIVVLNGLLGFSQEHKAEKAMAALRRLSAPVVRTRRDGKVRRVPERELVAGDVILLDAGALVPADARLLEAASLKVLEAPLTGEPEAVLKRTAPVDASAALAERLCMVYRGTTVAHGRGVALVTATGMRTELGRIAALMQRAGAEPTPLQKRLDLLGRRLAAAALAVVAAVFAMGLLRGEPLREMFLTAVSLAAAAVPEGLPAIVTIALALGARRMLARRALIRKLPAVETLGSVTVICSDKTGTLTEGRMAVSSVEGPEGPVLAAAALCNDATPSEGDPTEMALAAAAQARGLLKAELERALPRIAEAPFDSDRKRMTTVHAMRGPAPAGLGWLDGAAAACFTKGAAQAVLDACTSALKDGAVAPLDDALRRSIAKADERLARSGARVLALAARALAADPGRAGPRELERELVFLGLVGLSDPPRAQARDAVARCRRAGMRPVMITGDHPMTAQAIAGRVGIDAQAVVTGPELDAMDTAGLRELGARVSVYARVAPEHKLKIVGALQAAGQIVAMTGDGVNDAPALKEADIGVAMGVTGTDVAKEAADMVLLDDDFATIVAAVEEGRVIYDNLRRFVKYLVTTNSAEVLVMLLAPVLGMPLPLLPLQILWINLVTDGPTSLTLALEPGESGVMERPPRAASESLLDRRVGAHAVWVGLLMAALALGSGWWYWSAGDPAWRTVLFTTLTLAQLGHVLVVRSETRSLFSMGLRSNPWLSAAVFGTVALQLAAVYAAPLNALLSTRPLHAHDLAVVGALGSVVFWAVELEKLARRL